MRNSSISCGVGNFLRPWVLLGLVALLLWPNPAWSKKKRAKDYDPTFLIQPFVSPQYAQWLIGPVARMADEAEIEKYLGLQKDEEAAAFIEEFWKKRDPRPQAPGNPLRDLFEERAQEVDSLYGETLYRGRHTDRGTIFILYGPPEEVDREVAPFYGGSALEVWLYGKKRQPGLSGEKPDRAYRFIRQGDRTVFYDESIKIREERKNRRNPRPGQPPF